MIFFARLQNKQEQGSCIATAFFAQQYDCRADTCCPTAWKLLGRGEGFLVGLDGSGTRVPTFFSPWSPTCTGLSPSVAGFFYLPFFTLDREAGLQFPREVRVHVVTVRETSGWQSD